MSPAPAIDHKALNATIARTLDHVATIELDARMTVREYRDLQVQGYADPMSKEVQELWRMKREIKAAKAAA